MRCSQRAHGSLGQVLRVLSAESLTVRIELGISGKDSLPLRGARAVRVNEVINVALADDEISQRERVTEKELAGAGKILLDRVEEIGQDVVEKVILLLLLLNGVLLEEDGGRNLGEHIDVGVNNPVVLQLNLNVRRVVSVLSREQSEDGLGLVQHLAIVKGEHGQGPAVELRVLDIGTLPDFLFNSIIDVINVGVGQEETGRLSSSVKIEVGENDLLLATHGVGG